MIPKVCRSWSKNYWHKLKIDGEYTVFGEVVEGMDVVDLIQQVATNEADRPIDDVVIKKMTVLDN